MGIFWRFGLIIAAVMQIASASAQLPGAYVQQSGIVTANDCVAWVGNGIIKDSGSACGSGGGGVSSVSVTTANGVSGTVANPTTTPAISLTLGAITPTSVNGNTITTGTGILTLGAGKTLTVSNSLTLAGTDATTMTFPTTSATIARTDAAQTFTGLQTFSSTISGNISGNAATVTTNANLTGAVTSVGNATSLGTAAFTSAQLATALTDETGNGTSVFNTSPTLNTVDARGVWTTGTSWTLPAHTLGGSISGGANQINNVVIGTTSPLAGSFTTLTSGTGGEFFTIGPGGTGSLNARIKMIGANATAQGALLSLSKNDVSGSIWFFGHVSAIEGTGTSSDLEYFNSATTARTIRLSVADDSVSFASAVNATSGTVGAITTLGGIGATKDIWAGGNFVGGTATKTLVLKQGANGTVGTFVCTGGGTITISNTNVAITDAIIISLNTLGGTITTPPATKAITAATSFQALCGATDTSTYNYAIIKNAA